jgi:hypothetical protein
MELTGRLNITDGESSVNGTLLARCGASTPFSAATAFIRNAHFDEPDVVTVTGSSGTILGRAVLCITKVEGGGSEEAVAGAAPAAAKKAIAKKAAAREAVAAQPRQPKTVPGKAVLGKRS